MEPERAGRAVQQQEDDRREQPGAERGVGTPIAFCTALLMISSSTTLVGPWWCSRRSTALATGVQKIANDCPVRTRLLEERVVAAALEDH